MLELNHFSELAGNLARKGVVTDGDALKLFECAQLRRNLSSVALRVATYLHHWISARRRGDLGFAADEIAELVAIKWTREAITTLPHATL